MSERFYRQQMEYFSIKSVYELGQLHRGEITKRGKQPTMNSSDGTKRQVFKADVIVLVNKYFQEEVTGLEKLTVAELNDLLSALAFHQEYECTDIIPHKEIVSRTKQPYIDYIECTLALPQSYYLNITKLTIATLKQLLAQLCKGLNQ
jgi:hypothetical protein